jgi:hypothetical protein
MTKGLASLCLSPQKGGKRHEYQLLWTVQKMVVF